MAKNKGLGMGIDALMAMNVHETDDINSAVTAGFVELNIDEIIANPNQPRKEFDIDALHNLSQSIKNFGVIQPISVYKEDGKYIIIAGERRYRASKLAGLEKIPAIIKDLSKKEQFEMSIVENIQREDLNTIEEAIAFQSLIETYNMTHDHLAERIGKSRTSITNTLRLLNLDVQIQKWIIDGKITAGHARSILSIPEKEKHLSFANYVIENNLSVREAENSAKKWISDSKASKSKSQSSKYEKEIEIKIAEEKISSKIQAKVAISGSSKKGKITIEYFTLDELERMLDIFGVDMSN
ncbi:MAG: hypothetical protein A2015_10515 [Spirochaetes bacterium GWF1_31_7]|nr:MAG: hypothetical protein A2Y30_16255 [Spirochaetes bacterium GWE1_32_154]OHD48531.1 MAG: hypothetical protein A2Y29_14230 [Spirochaetes bacterium GWE2_31_10]OHD51446.1 MAG: hypothetical protein A2015_10515 [Spirochaetes bacterium GWF1_31_7]OHD80006.1 MAG: hypothetical protein A2355_12200 [Spirochaetes bacterium RIFOXYB1_FULL_32_8]HBD93339.1 chromosome partitioning protein ParB [Spirochaetia bacterium]